MIIRQKVLIVDDDREFCNYLCTLLSANEYEPLLAHTGKEALRMITSHCPEVILLDAELPDMSGMEILLSVRKWSLVPVLVLSDKWEESTVVVALDNGADDYLSKPFGKEELLARMRAAVRHTRTVSGDLQMANEGKLVVGGLMIDYNKYRVYLEGTDVNLTQNEFKMVAMLGKCAGKVLPYEDIMKALWGPNGDYDNQILRVNMANIRRKIEKGPLSPKYIYTENGIGYRMVTKEEVAQWKTEHKEQEK